MAMLDISSYKMELLRDIFNSPVIVDAIESQNENVDINSPDTLLYTHLFPYLKIPDTQTSNECYILLACDSVNPNKANKFFKDMRITFWVFCSSDRMRIKGKNSTRIDYIAQELERLFIGQTKYGFGELELVSNRELIYDPKYQYRELIFRTIDVSKYICN